MVCRTCLAVRKQHDSIISSRQIYTYQEVEWKGKAFPFLLHHPNSFLQTENYGSAKHQGAAQPASAQHAQHGADQSQRAATGTWDGPAPRGYIRDGVNTAAATTPAAVQQPQSVLLSSGVTLPLIGLGTAGIKSPDVIRDALALGYRHLDCAEGYRNHTVVGDGLKEFLASGKREELFITSKLHSSNFRPERVTPAVDKMLEELGCQHLDLLLMHWPEAQVPEAVDKDDFWTTQTIDTSVTIMDTWRELEKCVDAGLVKSLGVSNFSVKQVEQLVAESRIKPVANQIELHPFLPQRKMVGVCFRKGVQCVAYAPLGSSGYQHVNTLLTHPVVVKVAEETGKSPSQVLLRWNTQRGVPVIPRASSHEHLKQNLEGAFSWALSAQHKALLDGLENGMRFCNPAWKVWDDPEEGGAAKPSRVLGIKDVTSQ